MKHMTRAVNFCDIRIKHGAISRSREHLYTVLNMAFEVFFLTIVGDTTICADSFYFRFGFSPVENTCFQL